VISWRFEDQTVGFKDWRKNLVLQLGGIGFPSISRQQQHSHHVGRYPMSWFCPIYFSRDFLLESFGRMYLYGPRTNSNQWLEGPLAAPSGVWPRVHIESGGTKFSNSVAPVSVQRLCSIYKSISTKFKWIF
jgi:hypothetical protein